MVAHNAQSKPIPINMNIKGIFAVLISVILLASIIAPMSDLKSDDSTLDVIVIDGQSNAAYGNSNECNPDVVNEEYPEVPAHNLFYYGTSTAPIGYHSGYYDPTYESYGLHPLWANGSWIIGGYEPILANEISKRSDRDVLVINIAVAGFSLSKLEPGGVGGNYGFNALSDALSKIEGYDHVNKLGWIWIHGEADQNTSIDSYKYGFSKIQAEFSTFGFNDCYVVGVKSEWGGNSQIALKEIAEEDKAVTFVTNIADTFTDENGLMVSGDAVHFSQRGRDVIAQILGDSIPVYSYGSYNPMWVDLFAIIPLLVGASIVAFAAVSMIRSRY